MTHGRPEAEPAIIITKDTRIADVLYLDKLEHMIKDGIIAHLLEYIYQGVRLEESSDDRATNETYRRIEECAEGIVKQWRREFND